MREDSKGQRVAPVNLLTFVAKNGIERERGIGEKGGERRGVGNEEMWL